MRRYRIASWIVLILSIINFILAAPVAVRDTHGMRINVEDVAKNRIAALEKRMNEDSDGEGSDMTNEGEQPWAPHSDAESNNAPESESEPEPEPKSESESDSDSDDGGDDEGEGAQEEEVEPEHNEEDNNDDNQENHDQSDEEEQEPSDNEPESDVEDGHESPPNSPESEHPAGYTYESKGLSGWGKLLEDILRPRTSTSGAVDAPKRELRETDDTRASMVRDVNEFLNDPVTSTSSVAHGGPTSLYSPPGHSQNRKKLMLDRFD